MYIDAPASSQSTKPVPPIPYVEVRLFAKMDATKMKVFTLKSFYEGLPEELCVTDELSAKQADFANCWNGQSVGR